MFVATLAVMATTALIGLILTVDRFKMMVFGGGAQASSNEGRRVEMMMAWPHILSNPVTGHGFSMAPQVVGYSPRNDGTFTLELVGHQHSRRHGRSRLSVLFRRDRSGNIRHGPDLPTPYRSRWRSRRNPGGQPRRLWHLSPRPVANRKPDAFLRPHGHGLCRRQNRFRPSCAQTFEHDARPRVHAKCSSKPPIVRRLRR